MYLIFRLFNHLYRSFFALYKPIYFLYKRISDRRIISIIRNESRPGMVMLDIGAGIGFYSLLFSDLTGPTGKVIAFEPDRINYQRIKSLTAHRNNIEIHNLAVSDRTQTLDLFISKTMNVDHQTYPGTEQRESVKVSAFSVDDFLELNHPGIKIDLVKMDIQGYDFFGFMGMRTTLKRSINMILFGEFWPYGLEKSGIRPETYLKELENSGFKVTFIPEKKPSEIIAQTGNSKFYTDFVAVKKKEPSSK